MKSDAENLRLIKEMSEKVIKQQADKISEHETVIAKHRFTIVTLEGVVEEQRERLEALEREFREEKTQKQLLMVSKP